MIRIIDLLLYKKELDKLVKSKTLTKDTSNTYYSCMKVISDNTEGVDPNILKDFFFSRLNNRKQLMKYVAAIRKYETYVLKQTKGLLFGEPEVELFKKFKVKVNTPYEMQLTEETIEKKINALRNEKLKYALRLQIKSGLRVSEISKLRSEDIEFHDGKILIQVREGKGGKARDVRVLEDAYLYKRLPQYIEESTGENLFYSRDYLRIKASEYGIATHDLRRVNAQKRLKQEMRNGKSRTEAKKVVQKELGHELPSMTNIYISARVKTK